MEIPTNPSQLIDLLRAWFFAKDRSLVLAPDTFVEFSEIATPGNPVAGRHRLYPKADTYWYELVSNGTEGLLAGWNLISETVLSASVASVTFSSIPSGFRSLVLLADLRTDAAAELDTVNIRFNADAGTNYDYEVLFGSGASAVAQVARAVAGNAVFISEAANSRANCFAPNIGFFLDYANSSHEKFCYALNLFYGDRSADADLLAGIRTCAWRNTAAITSLVLVPSTGPNFVSGCKFQLYGIK